MTLTGILYVGRQGIWNVLYGLDCLGNAIIGGDPRETISSRAGKGKVAKKPVHTAIAFLIDLIFIVLTSEKNHCISNIQEIDDTYALSTIWSKSSSRARW